MFNLINFPHILRWFCYHSFRTNSVSLKGFDCGINHSNFILFFLISREEIYSTVKFDATQLPLSCFSSNSYICFTLGCINIKKRRKKSFFCHFPKHKLCVVSLWEGEMEFLMEMDTQEEEDDFPEFTLAEVNSDSIFTSAFLSALWL